MFRMIRKPTKDRKYCWCAFAILSSKFPVEIYMARRVTGSPYCVDGYLITYPLLFVAVDIATSTPASRGE